MKFIRSNNEHTQHVSANEVTRHKNMHEKVTNIKKKFQWNTYAVKWKQRELKWKI